jgi:hypothetical protein
MTTEGGIRCIQITALGACAVVIGPDHPEYEELRARDYEAGIFNDRYRFETRVLRGFWTMLWVQLTGAP